MSSSQGPNTNVTSKINAFQAFAHLPRTMKVAAATMRDRRVSVVPKILFIGSVVFVLAALLTPEALAEFVAVIPGLGDVLAIAGLPVDGVIDWLALGITALNMMKFFPTEIVNEHFDEVTAKRKPSGPIVDADPVH